MCNQKDIRLFILLLYFTTELPQCWQTIHWLNICIDTLSLSVCDKIMLNWPALQFKIQLVYLLPNANTWPTFIDFRTFYSMIRTIVTLVIITVIPNNWLGRKWTVKASDLNMSSADCHQVPDVLTTFIEHQCVRCNYNSCKVWFFDCHLLVTKPYQRHSVKSWSVTLTSWCGLSILLVFVVELRD